MMKKVIVFILLLLLCHTAEAQVIQGVHGGVHGSGVLNCMEGTYLFGWDGDWSGDPDKACAGSGDNTGIDGTITGTTISTAYGESGSYGMIIDGDNDYITYATSGDVHIDPSVAQTVWLRIYVSANPAQQTTIFRADGAGAGEYIIVNVATDGAIVGNYRNNTISVTNYSAGYVSTGTWIDVAYTWDPDNQDHDTTHNGTTWSEDANEITTVSTWDAIGITIGNKASFSPAPSYIYIDRIAIVSGYRASKPSGW